MPKRTDIESIMIIGAGPIVIGQACEFDYSGSQACRALKQEGYRVILVNSNPATIMTDPELADATYVEPVTPDIAALIIERERPDALLPTMGGQTGLNTAMALHQDGRLQQFGVELIGARAASIDRAEDRQLFREAMSRIGLESPRARMVSSIEEARAALEDTGLPAIIRPSFTLGGTGGGIAYNRDEFDDIARSGLAASPVGTVLIEESVLGWKEYEMEVVRDKADNCIIVCSIENIDPMGIHTGDSVTVAPALTLTDKEYQIMRNASIACLREIGVDTGGSNVQFAVNPDTGRLVVIEMNPRVSRSSALASKATGFPIAKVAARLAVGYTLDELQNEITRVTPASFEPAIDYVVTKMPRFTFEKFPGAEPVLTTSMKSVGEAMAIGRSFAESLQKALRSMETGLTGLDPVTIEGVAADPADPFTEVDAGSRQAIIAQLSKPTPDRLLTIAQAFRHGLTMTEVQGACRYDPWFLGQVRHLVEQEMKLHRGGAALVQALDRPGWMRLKTHGFSDARIAALAGIDEAAVRRLRHAAAVTPVYKRIDTCAAEFPSATSYLYSCYEGDGLAPGEDEAEPSDRTKVAILGGGPNRIGQGIEFDYCCVHAAYALADAGYETIMLNCNPETVSTDYDTSDRLYFDPLTAEDVVEVLRREQDRGTLKGAIVQLGGQTPLKLAAALEAAGIPILGTAPEKIDLAEDRERFQQLLLRLGLRQPDNGIATTAAQAEQVADRIGFPVVIRPSYVLGGRAMEIVHDIAGLRRYIATAVQVSGRTPVLIDGYLRDAVEIDVDALRDRDNAVYVAGIMEHIEEAGIHSGDSACALPPHSLDPAIADDIANQTRMLAEALDVVGLMNVQFAVQGRSVFILEVNPRASRTVPFVAKATGVPIAKIGARLMAGETLAALLPGAAVPYSVFTPGNHVAVKEAVFPFNRFPGVDTILGPEMKSTGEVMGIDRDFARAFAKSQSGANQRLPSSGTVFISVRDRDKAAVVDIARDFIALGFGLIGTRGTVDHLQRNGIACAPVKKVLEGRPHIVDRITDGGVQLVFNTTEGAQAIADSFSLRRAAISSNVPYYTTVAGARAVVEAIRALSAGDLEVAPLQSYFDPA